ncbi:pentatricopeptide repeat-containing protein At4g01990, mitochondrial-like [Wolffia australiana]
MARDHGRALNWARSLVRKLTTASADASDVSLSAAWSAGKQSSPIKLLYRRLSALGGQPKGVVVKTMNDWLLQGNGVGAGDIIRFVKELRKYKRFGHALELMEWMDSRGMNMSHSSYAVRLDLVYKVEGIKAAEKYFASFPEPAKNLLTYGSLLNCYCSGKMEDEASAFFEMMMCKKLVSNSLPYDNMMSLYMRLDKPEKVPPLIEEMTARKIAPSDFSYSILMNSYAATKNFDAVEETFKKIEFSGRSKPKWSIYTGLASLYMAADHVDKAEAALKKAEQNLDRGDRQCFHFLITLYAGMGKLEEVNRTWAALKSAFSTTLNMSYLTMLQSLSRLDQLELLEKCFQEWESGCTAYDIRLANILFAAYLRRNMEAEANALMTKLAVWNCEPDFRTMELFIDYYLGKEDMVKALEYMDAAITKAEKDSRGWKPNQLKIDAFLKYFEKEDDATAAEEFQERLRKLETAS